MVDPKNGFVREDGSIQMDIDFTITNIKFEGLPVDVEENSSGEEEEYSDEESISEEDEESGTEEDWRMSKKDEAD